jgi:hypothetical protein
MVPVTMSVLEKVPEIPLVLRTVHLIQSVRQMVVPRQSVPNSVQH